MRRTMKLVNKMAETLFGTEENVYIKGYVMLVQTLLMITNCIGYAKDPKSEKNLMSQVDFN